MDMQNQYKLLLKKLVTHSVWGVIIQCLVITSGFASEVSRETKNIWVPVSGYRYGNIVGRWICFTWRERGH